MHHLNGCNGKLGAGSLAMSLTVPRGFVGSLLSPESDDDATVERAALKVPGVLPGGSPWCKPTAENFAVGVPFDMATIYVNPKDSFIRVTLANFVQKGNFFSANVNPVFVCSFLNFFNEKI